MKEKVAIIVILTMLIFLFLTGAAFSLVKSNQLTPTDQHPFSENTFFSYAR